MIKLFLLPIVFATLYSCAQPKDQKAISTIEISTDSLQTAYFSAGCFWCVEAIFESMNGVNEVVSGYSGGTEKNPTYELVSSGKSMHAETVQIYYDSSLVSFEQLLTAFFGSHDPSTINQQGPDYGPQYRSIIFYQNSAEKIASQIFIKRLLEQKAFPKITTEIVPLEKFYKAEIYHQDYEENHPDNPYIKSVSHPRLDRFKKNNKTLLKRN
jgi:peptide-methionine (S)-S-oxide reductase